MRVKPKIAQVKVKCAPDAFDSTETVTRFLSFFGFSRVSKNREGEVVAKDIRIKCLLIFFIWAACSALAITFRFFCTYWMRPWNIEAYNEMIHCALLYIEILVIMFTAVNQSEEVVLEFYSNLNKLDDILKLRSVEHYDVERRSVNRLFFPLTVAYFIKKFVESVLWISSFGFLEIMPYANDYLNNALQMTFQFYYFIELSVYKTRLAAMNDNFKADLKMCSITHVKNDQNRYSEIMMKYKLCYSLLHAQKNIINQRHGLTILLSIACILISVIRTIYAMLMFAQRSERGYALAACVVRTIPELALLSVLVVYISRILGLRAHLLDTLERLLCSPHLSEGEQRSVVGLVEQMHRQPLRFTACDMFALDLTLLCAVLNFVVTNIIILTQIKAPTPRY